eukprot:gene12083-25329_t
MAITNYNLPKNQGLCKICVIILKFTDVEISQSLIDCIWPLAQNIPSQGTLLLSVFSLNCGKITNQLFEERITNEINKVDTDTYFEYHCSITSDQQFFSTS